VTTCFAPDYKAVLGRGSAAERRRRASIGLHFATRSIRRRCNRQAIVDMIASLTGDENESFDRCSPRVFYMGNRSEGRRYNAALANRR